MRKGLKMEKSFFQYKKNIFLCPREGERGDVVHNNVRTTSMDDSFPFNSNNYTGTLRGFLGLTPLGYWALVINN